MPKHKAEDLRRQDSVSGVSQNVARQAETEARTLSEALPKVIALFKYLRLDDNIHQAKCMPQPGKSITSLQHMGASSKQTGKRRSEQQSKAVKLAQLEAIRRELEQLSTADVISRLRTVFDAYCSKKRCVATGRYEMDVMGFLRLLRDCRILDNRLTIMQADSVFSGGRIIRGEESSYGSTQQEIYINFDTFLAKLKRIIRVKNPPSGPPPVQVLPPRVSLNGTGIPIRKSMSGSYNLMPPPLCEDPEIAALARTQILPHHRAQGDVKAVDVLYTPPMLDLLREWDAQLRSVYAAFASLEESDPQRTTWEIVRSAGNCIGRTEFMLMLLNYQVLPVLLAKHEALEVFVKHRNEVLRGAAETSKKDPLSQPSFVEALANIALYIADHAAVHIHEAMASPDDMRRLQRYVACLEGPLRQQLQETFEEASQLWSQKYAKASDARRHGGHGQGLSSSMELLQVTAGRSKQLPPWLRSCDGDPLLAEVKHKAWEREQRTVMSARLAVMARREDVRMKLALTRLHNSYKDVRPLPNTTTWPMQTGSLPTISATHSLPLAAASVAPSLSRSGARSEVLGPVSMIEGGRPNPVAFYSDSLQIKTPKPASMTCPPSLAMSAPPWGPRAPFPVPEGSPLEEAGAPGAAAGHLLYAGAVGNLRASDPGWLAQGAPHHVHYPEPPSQQQEAGGYPYAPLPPPLFFHGTHSGSSGHAGVRAQQKAETLEVIRGMQKGEAIQFISSMVQQHSVAAVGSPGTADGLQRVVAGYGFVPLPTPKPQLEPIEARDEYEVMQQVAERLPALKL